MVTEVRCIHAGFEECEFLVRSESEAELVEIVQTHAQQTHNVAVSQGHVRRIARDV